MKTHIRIPTEAKRHGKVKDTASFFRNDDSVFMEITNNVSSHIALSKKWKHTSELPIRAWTIGHGKDYEG